MKSVKERENNVNSACNVVSLQSNDGETEKKSIRDKDLIINLDSDVQSCDNSENDVKKTFSPNPYNFEQDIEKLIEVSKQFQTEYENEKAQVVDDDGDNILNIQILTSNSNSLRRQKTPATEIRTPENDNDNYYFSKRSSRKENVHSLRTSTSKGNKTFTPILPNLGQFGTGIIRPTPKKHSCVKTNSTTSVRRSHRTVWNIRPYTTSYYNFDRIHPDLKLVEDGYSIIPKRIHKETTEMAHKTEAERKRLLLNEGLTWHEFLERSNVYSAKSVQSSYGNVKTQTTSTQTVIPESIPPNVNELNKIQKYILPQLNIRAECCVQRIPEVSIAPNGFRRTMKSNIKLVEIIYEGRDSKVQDMEEPMQQSEQSADRVRQEKHLKTVEPLMDFDSDPEHIPSEVSGNEKPSESKILETTTSKTSSDSHGYDSSLEESISLNISRLSAITDHEIMKKSLKDAGVQTHKLKRFAKTRKEIDGQFTIMTSSDYSDYQYNAKHLREPQQETRDVQLPTFPTNELIKMVDEIFDTSSDAVNMSCKYLVKETSVQTDIVWENITDLFNKQSAAIHGPISTGVQNLESTFTDICVDTADAFVSRKPQAADDRILTQRENDYVNTGASTSDFHCRHTTMKKFEICSCIACKTNIRFSAMNVHQSPQRSSSDESSSSAAFEYSSKPPAKFKLLPSERYKQMKQAQREHFENDPRISKTLKKIYETAKIIRSRHESTSSSSSGHIQVNHTPPPLSGVSSLDDQSLQPDLYTYSDEMLLFGLCSSNENQFSSHLLKTESSQDTVSSNDGYYRIDNSKEILHRNKLMCTNSEDSGNSFLHKPESDLERDLLRDIENSGSDPTVLSTAFSTSSLERKINEFQLDCAT